MQKTIKSKFFLLNIIFLFLIILLTSVSIYLIGGEFKIFMGLLLVVLLIQVMSTYFYINHISKNISNLNDALKKTTSGAYSAPLVMEPESELTTAATVFNETNQNAVNSTLWQNNIQDLFDSINESIIILSPEKKITSINKATSQMLGFKEEDLIGKPFSFILPEDKKSWQSVVDQISKNDYSRHKEATYIKNDKKKIPILLSSTKMYDGQSKAQGIFCVAFDTTERKMAEEQIEYLAYYDSLTKLPNRLLLRDRLKQAMIQADRYSRLIAILIIDIDNFKKINDTLGHRIGDLLLQEASKRLTECLRKSDTIAAVSHNEDLENSNTLARMGGDEFTIILTEVVQGENASKAAYRVLKSLAKPYDLDGNEIFITASAGITIYPTDSKNIDDLLKNADAAMYNAKEHGKNNYKFYQQSMNAIAFNRFILENNLRKALEREEFCLYYQPQFDMTTKKISGFEALIRWNHPEMGLVSPAEFIPLAEDTGLIIPISEWVIHSACMQNKKWQDLNLPPISISVNLSGRHFKQQKLKDLIVSILNESGLEAQYLTLEITESILMQDTNTTFKTLKELTEMGIRFSIDDFGTGYSSLSYLKKFPLHALKIDRSFVQEVATSSDDSAICNAIIAMAKSLRLKTVAEGVETESQLLSLKRLGCESMQGYLLSQPLPASEIEDKISPNNSDEFIGLSLCQNILSDEEKKSKAG